MCFEVYGSVKKSTRYEIVISTFRIKENENWVKIFTENKESSQIHSVNKFEQMDVMYVTTW